MWLRQITGPSQDAVCRSHEEVERALGEGVVPQFDVVEFLEYEGSHVIGIQAFGDD